MPATATLDDKTRYLAACRSWAGRRIKSATLGGEPEQPFEHAFANLGFTYLKDKAPRLLDYMAGFQLIDRNNDNTKSVGVFGFKVGNTWVYAPVFFLNGDLKGHELMYVKNQNLFLPLKEAWVNYLLARKPTALGEQTSETTRQLGVRHPDLRSYSIPPSHKYGFDRTDYHDWYTDDCLPAFAKLATTSPGFEFAVPKLIREFRFAAMLKRACDVHPTIAHYCRKFYGPDFLKEALEEIKSKAQKQIRDNKDKSLEDIDREERMERRISVLNEDEKKGSFLLTGRTKAAAADPDRKDLDIKVLDDAAITVNDPELSAEQKKRLFRDGYLVRDYRTGDEVSVAYSIDKHSNNELTNPSKSGVYELLVRPAKFEEMLIVDAPFNGRGPVDSAVVVRMASPRNWTNCHRSTLWVKPHRMSKQEEHEWFDKLKGAGAKLQTGGTYIVVATDERGGFNGSTPFEVLDSLGKGRYRVCWKDWSDRERPKWIRPQSSRSWSGLGTPSSNYDDDDGDFNAKGDMLYLTDREGVSFRNAGGGLMAPAGAKVLQLKAPYRKNDDGCMTLEPWHSDPDAIDPGDWSDLHLHILQKTAELKVFATRDGCECCINNGPPQPKLAAFFELIRDYGFREDAAKQLIKEAEQASARGSRYACRVKYADNYPSLIRGQLAPAIPDPQFSSSSFAPGVTEQLPMELLQQIPELSPSLTDPSTYDASPEYMPDDFSMQVAQQAGDAGQKEVFDTAMLGSLLKTVRQDTLADRYLPDLLKAVDRLGRILFLFYWHNDEFAQRYGKSEMPELEDTLRNALEVTGDLVLFLKSKSIAPMPGIDMGSADISDDTGD